MENNFKYEIDGYKFHCNNDKLNYELKKLDFYYKMDKNSAIMSIIVCDDKNLENYFINQALKLLEEFQIFELTNLKDIRTFNILLKSNVSLLISKLKEFRMYCDRIYDNKGAEHLWMWMFNLRRNSVFSENNARLILVLDDEEYTNLVLWAKDFQEYCKFQGIDCKLVA